MSKIFYVIIILCGLNFIKNKNIQKFICEDGSEIDLEKICDGTKDCFDGSDEVIKLCYHLICPEYSFRCHYGACIHEKSRCDGTAQCVDSSDENNCGNLTNSCMEHQFKCLSGECVLNSQLCDGQKNCVDNSDEDRNVCDKITCPINTFHCRYGGCIHLNQRCNGHKDCIDGSDESELMCKILKCSNGESCKRDEEKIRCPPITSNRIDTICHLPFNNGNISCNQPLPVGTIVQYNCKAYYIPTNERHLNNKKVWCQSDGTWSRDILTCKPDCGKVNDEMGPLILKGWATKNQKFPWHATLYALQFSSWTFICGGSLITERVVITAAHCTWSFTKEQLKIGLGKYYNDYLKQENYTQMKNIGKIIQHPLYQDITGNFASDIAILVLKENVEFSSFIKPICIDGNIHNFHLPKNKLGMVVGMGLTENDTFSTSLRTSYIPIISDIECIRGLKYDFRKYVTVTTFCGGWRNGTAACNGDSGGGFVFPPVANSNKWTLYGIVSVSPRRLGTSFCDPKSFTIFTKIEMYVKWIHSILKSIHLNEIYYPFIDNVTH